jgi:hypothetical protein
VVGFLASIALAMELAEEAGPGFVYSVPWTEGAGLYRLLSGEKARRRDFTSSHERGKPVVRWCRNWSLHVGLSMADTIDGAKARASRSGFIAILAPRTGLGTSVAKTLGPGHFTVWGDPDELVACVQMVLPFTL